MANGSDRSPQRGASENDPSARHGQKENAINEAQAAYWANRAAEGCAEAQYALSVCLQKGLGTDVNLEQAFRWCSSAAEQGHPLAMFNVGTFYHHGHGCQENLISATTWYRKAVEAGEARAGNNLGVCYENGLGVELDLEQAVVWYRKAVELRSAPAMCNLGMLYLSGRGVEKCEREAVALFKESASYEYTEAEYKLGQCFRDGMGLRRDLERAYNWLKKAADQGHEAAQRELDALVALLLQEDTNMEYEPAPSAERGTLATPGTNPGPGSPGKGGGNAFPPTTVHSSSPNADRSLDLGSKETRSCSNPACTNCTTTFVGKPGTGGRSSRLHFCSEKCRKGVQNHLISC
mmetsp:Transcript_14408/g.17466  ORF Transcript_14408/g.17466 Transcript_14408/m.17466 type:complete len:349 (-) Transcript_14408:327-1373(-)